MLGKKLNQDFSPQIETLYYESRKAGWTAIGRFHTSIWIVIPIIFVGLAHIFQRQVFMNIQQYFIGFSLISICFLGLTYTRFFQRHLEILFTLSSVILQSTLIGVLTNQPNDQLIIASTPVIFILLFTDFFMLPTRHRHRAISGTIISAVTVALLLERGVFPNLYGGPFLLLLYFVGIVLVGIGHSYRYELLDREKFISDLDLAVEKENSEKILHQVLPTVIAEKLKHQDHRSIAEYHPKAIVFFADLKGFTSWSAENDAHNVVSMLDRIFDGFDEAAAMCDVQKIKTIGDSYMAAAGVLQDSSQSAVRMGKFAIQALSNFEGLKKEFALPLSVRIGIHLGPVVSGVIGKKMYSFDIWGQTVNYASRLETNALPGRICVSAEFYEETKGFFQYTDSTIVVIKGIGKRKVFHIKNSENTLEKAS